MWQCFKKHIDEIFIIVVLLLVALAVAVMVSEKIECWLQQLLELNEKYDVLKFIGYCVAGVVSIWLARAANKRAKAMEDTAKNTEDGQRQERLKNAIEHLGHKRDSVRISGAYNLFRLAEGSGYLRQTVMDILCVHIRKSTRGKNYQAEHKTKPSEEIQGLLTLLFIEEHDVFGDCSINLQDSYLSEAKLSKARLQGANLKEARLQGADLSEAQLQKADLEEARLQVANLSKAQLQGADIKEAQLQVANLSKAQLQKADLTKAQLQGANLKGVQLRGVSSWAHSLLSFLLSSPLSSLLSEEFKSKIRDRIGKPSGLKGTIFAGGLQEEELNTLCEGLSDDQAQELRKALRDHVGKPASYELPKK